MVLTRFDSVWMASLPLHLLSPQLLYVAHWCVTAASDRRVGRRSGSGSAAAAGPGGARAASDGAAAAPSAAQGSCRPLQPFAPETHQKDGVPDYFFAGSGRTTERVFSGLSDALVSGALQVVGRSCCNHAILASRLKAVGLWPRLGRVLVHHMDIETLRQPKFDVEGRWACAVEQDIRRQAGRSSSGGTFVVRPSS